VLQYAVCLVLQHINSVHLKTTAFYCDICRKYFLRKKQLIEHAAIVHPGVPILSTKMDDDVTLANQVEATAMSTANSCSLCVVVGCWCTTP